MAEYDNKYVQIFGGQEIVSTYLFIIPNKSRRAL